MIFDEVFGNYEADANSFISSKATVIGQVFIEENVIIAPKASVRADEGTPFKICKGTNIQDEVVIHGLLDQYVEIDGVKYSVYIGSHCSIAHQALIHGPTMIGKKTFVGFRATIHKSIIGRHCYVGIGAIIEGVNVSDNRYVPNGAVIDVQKYADELPFVPEDKAHFNKEVVDYNKQLVRQYQIRRKQMETRII